MLLAKKCGQCVIDPDSNVILTNSKWDYTHFRKKYRLIAQKEFATANFFFGKEWNTVGLAENKRDSRLQLHLRKAISCE